MFSATLPDGLHRGFTSSPCLWLLHESSPSFPSKPRLQRLFHVVMIEQVEQHHHLRVAERAGPFAEADGSW